MKKLSIAIVLLFIGLQLATAQEAIEKEVNETVWKPFIESWSTYDAVAFNNLHTDDVLRASGRGLRVGSEYKEINTRMFERGKQKSGKRMIHFWFEHRVYSGDTGYEVGYYKVVNSQPGQEDTNFYARFHIVLKKVNGQWKIAQDWDTGNINGHKVTEEDWLKGAPVEF